MNHTSTSQGNETLDTKNADADPNTTLISRTNSLSFRVLYIVSVHTIVYVEFHEHLAKEMNGTGMNSVLRDFFTTREVEAPRKKAKDTTIERKRSKKEAFNAKV